tara:strand:+ start:203 stop:424 length:222 start_codon:yes stop_codon:yes gene_type:complete
MWIRLLVRWDLSRQTIWAVKKSMSARQILVRTEALVLTSWPRIDAIVRKISLDKIVSPHMMIVFQLIVDLVSA